jgi:dCMP deaminase
MQLAFLIAQRSKDPNTQNGACIVDSNHVVIALGYNGFPRGCSDDDLPWGRAGEFTEKKYAYVVHAETNAIYNASTSVRGCRLYATLFPCNECAKALIQTGIREIIYADDFYHDDPQWVASRRMLDLAGVTYRQYVPRNNWQEVMKQSDPAQSSQQNLLTPAAASVNQSDSNTKNGMIFEPIPL